MGAYGEFGDKSVSVGVRSLNRKGSRGSAWLTEEDVVAIEFNPGLEGDELAAVIAHEGVHAADFKGWLTGGTDYSLKATEGLAWFVSSYVAQALGMRTYGPGGQAKEVWNRGWRRSDVSVLRARGVANIIRDTMYVVGNENPTISQMPRRPAQ